MEVVLMLIFYILIVAASKNFFFEMLTGMILLGVVAFVVWNIGKNIFSRTR